MTEAEAAEQLSALSHETRLKVFRALINAGPSGLPAGMLSERLGVAPNTLSSHLTILLHAGLTQVRKDGRRRVYSADLEATGAILRFLVADCCGGRPEACDPVRAALVLER